MTRNKTWLLNKKYEVLTDKELAKEFVQHDKYIIRHWEDPSDDMLDEHLILQDLICERFVKRAKIGVEWDNAKQNWIKPGCSLTANIPKVIDYWVPID